MQRTNQYETENKYSARLFQYDGTKGTTVCNALVFFEDKLFMVDEPRLVVLDDKK